MLESSLVFHSLTHLKDEPLDSFQERWRKKEAACWRDKFRVDFVTVERQSLPSDAAPFLHFFLPKEPGAELERMGFDTEYIAKEVAKERERMSGYLQFGGDGAGNPICVKEENGEIWLLDHDNGLLPQFMNTSIGQLAECLLAYMGEKDSDRFRSTIQEIDAAALSGDAFWAREASFNGAN